MYNHSGTHTPLAQVSFPMGIQCGQVYAPHGVHNASVLHLNIKSHMVSDKLPLAACFMDEICGISWCRVGKWGQGALLRMLMWC